MAVDVADDLPAIGLKALGRVVGKPFGHVAVDGDAIVVIKRDQLAEAEPAGKRSRLMTDAFHQAAVAYHHESAVVDDRMSGPVELRGQRLLGDCHADRIGESLPQWAGGGLDPDGDAEFWMARCLGMQLPEALDLRNRQVIAG
jgi:hypothetical protein